MAMWNETDLDITFEDDMDHSAVVRECFGVASLEDDADGFLYYKSFSGNSGKYNISYHERGYFDHGFFIEKIRNLARKVPHHPFYLFASVFNDGSGGNYHDEIKATYKYGALDWKYYCDYEQEDKLEVPPQLVGSDKEQLFPQIDFIQDIAEDEKKERLHKEKEQLLKTGKVRNAEGKVFITTGLTVDEEHLVRDAVERSGGIFKEKFVKGISYLIYNPEYGRETTKLRDAKALVEEGKDVKIITYEAFKGLLYSESAAEKEKKTDNTPKMPKKANTKAYKYSAKVSFELPKGYEFIKEKDEEGNDIYSIRSKPYTDEDGEKKYRFICGINEAHIEYKNGLAGKKRPSGRALLEETVKPFDDIHYFFLPGTPDSLMLCKAADFDSARKDAAGILANLLILMSRPFGLGLRSIVDEHTMLNIMCVGVANDSSDPDYLAKFEGMIAVAGAIRINGEPLQLGKLTPKLLESAFSPATADNKGPADITQKLKKVLTGSEGSKSTAASSVKSSAEDVSNMFPASFPVAEVKKAYRKLLDRKPKKNDSPNRYDLQLVFGSNDPDYYNGTALFYFEKIWPGFSEKRADLLNTADEFVQIFRDDSANVDLESELRQGLIRKAYTLHALKSFVWTSVEYCQKAGEDLSDFSLDQCLALAQFIFDHGGANWEHGEQKDQYGTYSHELKAPQRPGAGLLWKEETTWYKDASLYWLISSLHCFVPVMRRIRDYLSEEKDLHNDAADTLKHVLAGWCAFSIACGYNYISQRSGPENLIPVKFRDLPKNNAQLTVMNEHFYVIGDGLCIACTDPGKTIDFPEGVKAVSIPGQSPYTFTTGSREYNRDAEKIVFPRSCNSIPPKIGKAREVIFQADFDEIKTSSWDNISPTGEYNGKLERVSFLGSAYSLGSYALHGLPLLKEVALPQGLKRIEQNALYDTPSLNSILIPPTVEEIEDGAFHNYKGHKTELVVEKGSTAEAVVRKFAEGKDYVTCRVILSEAEQKRVEEENRLKRIAAALQQKLTAMYQDRLDASQIDSLKNAATIVLTTICDKQTWCEIQKRKIPTIPMMNLIETNRRLAGVSPEESYDLLPEWIAEEYIHSADEKRALSAFEKTVREFNGLANEPVLPAFESGIEKSVVLGQLVSRAKTAAGDGTVISEGLAKYNGNAALETLRLSLCRKPFDSAESLIDAIIEKKSAEIDRLTSLLEKKNSDLEVIEKEKAALEEERSHLGFFHGKRKKEIAAMLEKIPERIKQIEEEYEQEKKLV